MLNTIACFVRRSQIGMDKIKGIKADLKIYNALLYEAACFLYE